jgi:LAS superfamily LD-carboxypeptidase LdcB
MPSQASGGGYSGPLAYREGKPMRPDVAAAFDRMAGAARREAGLSLSISSGFRSDVEQARLFALKPTPYLLPALESRSRGCALPH